MATENDYSFKAFSGHAFFREVNAALLDRAGLTPGTRVVDVACGSGLVTELILERIRGARDSVVVALDVSSSALREARERLAGAAGEALQFVEARAEELSKTVGDLMDAVVFCNGIHYVEDKRALLREVRRVLRPGGVFAFNTSFFDGAIPPETLAFYRRWMLRALRTLKERYDVLPDRTKVSARRQLTRDQYVEALVAEGFEPQYVDLMPAVLSEQGWVDISRFADFAQGTLPGVPVEQACEVLSDSVRSVFAELKLEGVPRNWLSVVAQRA